MFITSKIRLQYSNFLHCIWKTTNWTKSNSRLWFSESVERSIL